MIIKRLAKSAWRFSSKGYKHAVEMADLSQIEAWFAPNGHYN